MAEFKINGRMKVKTLKELFFNEFEGTLRVYDGKKLADDEATLASIRSEEGAKGGEFVCRASRTVGKFEEEMKTVFGITVQVATRDNWVLVLDGITLSKIKDIPNYAKKETMEEFVSYKRKDVNAEEKPSEESLNENLETVIEDNRVEEDLENSNNKGVKFTTIPYSYDWDEILNRMEEDEEYDTCDIENDMISLINDPSTKWVDVPDDDPMLNDGLYVMDFESYLYTIMYKGVEVLSICW